MIIDHPDLERLGRLARPPIGKAENAETQHHDPERDG
jgi:hypothetical protein